MPATPPINELAPEILGQIFELRKDSIKNDGRALLQLVGVCRYWKEILEGHPQFWTVVECSLPGESDWTIRMPGIIRSMKRWFGRAGDLPLSLHVAFRSDITQFDHSFLEFVAGCSQLGALRFLDLRMEPPMDKESWEWILQLLNMGVSQSHSSDTRGCWPMLKKLEIVAPKGSLHVRDAPTLPLVNLAPNLEAVELDFGSILLPTKYTSFWSSCWSKLTSLSVRGLQQDGCSAFLLSILDNAKNLRRLKAFESVTYGYEGSQNITGIQPFSHLNLQHLSIDIHEKVLKPFFQNIKFPELRSMELRCRGLGHDSREYARFLNWSLEEPCKDAEFWPQLNRFSLILGHNLIVLKEGEPGFTILKQGPWTWYILARTPFGTS